MTNQTVTTNDPYLDSFLYIFTNHSKLQNYLTAEYFSFESLILDIKKIKKVSKSWSLSEKFMLDLALHLYGIQGKVDLNTIDYLDQNNKRLAMAALKIRFKGM